MRNADPVSDSIQSRQFFFGHKSVGDNILSGIKSSNSEIAIYDRAPENEEPGLYNIHIGENTRPKLKIDHFVSEVRNLPKNAQTTALMKLCYVDFSTETDPKELFEYYKSSMDKLQKERPDVEILHFTAPIVVKRTGPKQFVKRILGRNVYGTMDNAIRFQYNEYIRREYGDKVFDIAGLESVDMSGDQLQYEIKGNTYQAMYPQYSTDGGHLNSEFSRYVGGQFLKFLADHSD